MRAITWKLGSEPAYDRLFEQLRETQYQDRDHPLWSNYERDHFWNECTAVTIAFNPDNQPVLCSSILKRTCWPAETYRIINRLWKVGRIPKDRIRQFIPEGEYLLKSQIQYLKDNLGYDLIFVSREAEHWQQWTINQFKNYGELFEMDNHLYQVCNTPRDSSCWQRIIYQGKKEILEQWCRK